MFFPAPVSSGTLQSMVVAEPKHVRSGTDSSGPTIVRRSSLVSSPAPSVANHFESQDTEYNGIEKRFNDLAGYLGTSVLLSSFITTIIISFLTFAHEIIQNPSSLEFQVGMLLCFLAAICHISIILIAGRACILAYKYSRLPPTDRPTVEEYQKQLDSFGGCLKVSENVQAIGQALFGPAIMYTMWQMFENHIFVIILYAFIVVLDIVVYVTGFWRVSWVGTLIVSIQENAIDPVHRRLRSLR